jgi:hypothetical protein
VGLEVHVELLWVIPGAGINMKNMKVTINGQGIDDAPAENCYNDIIKGNKPNKTTWETLQHIVCLITDVRTSLESSLTTSLQLSWYSQSLTTLSTYPALII